MTPGEVDTLREFLCFLFLWSLIRLHRAGQRGQGVMWIPETSVPRKAGRRREGEKVGTGFFPCVCWGLDSGIAEDQNGWSTAHPWLCFKERDQAWHIIYVYPVLFAFSMLFFSISLHCLWLLSIKCLIDVVIFFNSKIPSGSFIHCQFSAKMVNFIFIFLNIWKSVSNDMRYPGVFKFCFLC
jgi:hypothetical protein